MKTKIMLLAVVWAGWSVQAADINFTSPAFEIGRASSGDVLTADFTFALGSFGSFSPTSTNMSLWSASFTTLATTSWDEGFQQFSGTASLTSNSAPFSTSTVGFVWGLNSDGTEWFLASNANWTFPSFSELLPVTWDISDPGTVTIMGSIANSLGVDPFLQTAAVPEPSQMAIAISVAALGAAFWRARRQGRKTGCEPVRTPMNVPLHERSSRSDAHSRGLGSEEEN